MSVTTLADLDSPVEEQIVRAYAALVRADPILGAVFSIRVLEPPSWGALKNVAAYTMAIMPYQVKATEFPGHEEETLLGILTIAILAPEDSESPADSRLDGLRIGNALRKIAFINGGALTNSDPPPAHLTDATVDFSQLTALVPVEGVRVLQYRTVYTTKIDPTDGSLT